MHAPESTSPRSHPSADWTPHVSRSPRPRARRPADGPGPAASSVFPAEPQRRPRFPRLSPWARTPRFPALPFLTPAHPPAPPSHPAAPHNPSRRLASARSGAAPRLHAGEPLLHLISPPPVTTDLIGPWDTFAGPARTPPAGPAPGIALRRLRCHAPSSSAARFTPPTPCATPSVRFHPR